MRDRRLYEEVLIAKEALYEWATSARTSQYILKELEKLGTQRNNLDALREKGNLPVEALDMAEKELSNRINELLEIYEHVGAKTKKINNVMLRLDPEEIAFIKFRYLNEMQAEEIAGAMHISRATYFRRQTKIINKIIPLMKNEGWNFDV